MKNIKSILFCILIFTACNFEKPAFRFSNFYDTPAENIARAIKENDAEEIREEILKNKVNINFEDGKYEVSLLALSIANDRKDAFIELLKLGANPNITNSYCVSPLITAIRYNKNCDLFFVKGLLNYNAQINPKFFEKCNNFTHDPISETILHYNDENRIECGLEILKLLTDKLNNPDLLNQHNNPEDFHENIIYNSINTNKNLSALKYLIVDLKFNVPDRIFIDGTVLLNYNGYKSLEEILKSREFSFNEDNLFREKAKDEILNYLERIKQ